MGFAITLLNLVFNVLQFVILARVIVSWLPMDPYHPAIQFLYSITEPILAPLRRIIPPMGMIDISPVIALIGLQILQTIIMNMLFR